MRFKLMALAATVSFAVPAVAQTADSATPAPKKEKKSCRRLDQTGSILGSRPTCHTKSEWDAIDAVNRRNTDQTMDTSRRVGGSRTNGSF